MTPRNAAIAGAAAAVAVALVAVPVLRHRSGNGPVDSLRPVAAEPGGARRAAPSPTSTPSPTARPSVSPSAAPSPTPSAGGDDAMFGPSPGAVSFRYEPGRADWSAVSNGVRISVHIAPTVPKFGQVVRFDVTASAPSGTCCYVTMIYGDGFQSPQGECVASGTSVRRAFEHAYNKAGRKRFAVGASRGGCASGGGIFASLDVAAGQTTAQGPALPVVHVDTAARPAGHEDDTSYVTLAGDASDDDGYVSWFVVDWGDGATSTYHNGDPCQRSTDGWPTPSWAPLPGEPNPPTHHYAKAGTFRVTLTAYSTSCDGAEVQHAAAYLDWVWAPPES